MRVSARLDLAITGVVMAGFVLGTIIVRWDQWGPDLMALYMAGHFAAIGAPEQIYLVNEIPFLNNMVGDWPAVLAAHGHADAWAFPYLYPPLWAYLAGPITQILGPQGFTNAFAVFNITALAWAPLMVRSMLGDTRLPCWLWAGLGIGGMAVSAPVDVGLDYMNPQITVSLLTLLAFERLAHGRQVTAGALLAVAASIKLLPMVFVAIFLIAGARRAIFSFGVLCAGLAGASILVAGWPLHVDFLVAIDRATALQVVTEINWSLRSILLWVAPHQAGAEMLYLDHMQTIWTKPAAIDLIGKAMLALFVWQIWRLAAHVGWREWLTRSTLLMMLASGLTAPFAWAYYFLAVPAFLPMLLRVLPWRIGLAAFALFTALLTRFAAIWAASQGYGPGMAVLGALTLLLLFLVVALPPGHTRAKPRHLVPKTSAG